MGMILTFDVGTTSMKCCAFDENFAVAAASTAEYALETKGSCVEADPELYWQGLCSSTKAVLSQGVPAEAITAVAITTQGETMIALDDNDKPVLPAIVWLDERAGEQARELTQKIGADRLYRTTGLPSITGAAPIAKLKWLMDQPELKQKIRKVLLLEDYLIYRLSGAFATEQSLVCSTGYYNILAHRYESDFLTMTGVGKGILPTVYPCGTVVGTVTAQAAAQTGLQTDCSVVCTAMDQTASAVGAGNVEPGVVSETTGTCLTVAAATREPNFETGSELQYYTHYDGSYLALAYNPTAAIVMKWFKDHFVQDTEGCVNSGENPYQYMSKLAAGVPAGCDGVMLLPHFAGKVMPKAVETMRGAFAGVGLGTTRAHFIRAIMEGVSFMLKENLSLFERAGIAVSQIRSLGGGARDQVWCQIKADVIGQPVITTANEESTSLGAAILAMKAMNPETDVPAICRKAVRMQKQYLPGKDAPIYPTLYQKYLRLDALLEQFYTQICDY